MRDSSFYAVFFGGYELSCYLFRTYCPSMPDELNYFIRYANKRPISCSTKVLTPCLLCCVFLRLCFCACLFGGIVVVVVVE